MVDFDFDFDFDFGMFLVETSLRSASEIREVTA